MNGCIVVGVKADVLNQFLMLASWSWSSCEKVMDLKDLAVDKAFAISQQRILSGLVIQSWK